MARFIKSRENIAGLAPGTMTFIGQKKMDKPRLRLISFDESEYVEKEYANVNELLANIDQTKVNWINVDGLHDQDTIRAVGTYFNLSALVLEDIVNTDQHPKFIDESDHIVVFLKMLSYNQEIEAIKDDQITIVLGANFVLTFQEAVGSHFDPIRERIRQNIGKLRSSKSDYLFYRVIDTIADNYLYCVGILGEIVENNEEHILSKINKGMIEEIYWSKTEISYIRKAVRPAKEITKKLKNSETELIEEKTWPFFEDLDDLLTHSLETVEVYYTMISDQLNIYNTNLSNSANDVMKVLTIFAAIFIPLTFIAGVYGTNFDNVPELHYKYSYFIMLGVMFLVAGVMLFYFRRKKWF